MINWDIESRIANQNFDITYWMNKNDLCIGHIRIWQFVDHHGTVWSSWWHAFLEKVDAMHWKCNVVLQTELGKPWYAIPPFAHNSAMIVCLDGDSYICKVHLFCFLIVPFTVFFLSSYICKVLFFSYLLITKIQKKELIEVSFYTNLTSKPSTLILTIFKRCKFFFHTS